MAHDPSPNFAFLGYHDPRLVALATQAEQHFAADPIDCLFKLRQFGVRLVARAAADYGFSTEFHAIGVVEAKRREMEARGAIQQRSKMRADRARG